jgi:Leucine-rich repeat (LRR) protein
MAITVRRLSLTVLGLLLILVLAQSTDTPSTNSVARAEGICDNVTEIPKVECEALVALYNSTNGSGWTDNTGWLVTSTPCNWYGITCTAGHVTSIILFSNRLVGTIPAEIGNLPELVQLYLVNNQLSGTIPPEIGNLTNLERLRIETSNLTGSIPSEIGNAVSLQILYLAQNQLTGEIPREIGNLVNLSELSLYSNQLSGDLPNSIGNLSALTRLSLWNNQFTGIPPEIGNLQNLWWLHMAQNQLSGPIPSEIGQLQGLTYLDLSYNSLTSLPASIANATNLTHLKLDHNLMSGSIPPEVGQMSKLVFLDLSFNSLSGTLPAEIGNLSSLRYLTLSNNDLEGSIPTTIGNLRSIDSIVLSDNNLTGPLPSGICGLSHTLDQLWLSNNHLSGELPLQIGYCSGLREILVDGNHLSGPLPTTFTRLTNMHAFYFDRTALCEPETYEFQLWFNSIEYLRRTNVYCGRTLTGSVSDGYGKPLAGVLLSIGNHLAVTTDSTGAYTQTNMKSGSYVITPTLSGYAFSPTSRVFSIPPDAPDINFVATRLYSVSGQITYAAGTSVPDVVVRADDDHSATSDATGHYTLTNLLPGTYTLTPSKSNHLFEPLSRTAEVSDEDVEHQDFVAVPLYSISGRLVGPEAECTDSIVVSCGGGTYTITDSSGAYSLTDLPADTYVVAPSKHGCVFVPPSRTVVVNGTNVKQQDFAATLLVYSVSGRIADGNGNGIADLTVWVSSDDCCYCWSATTDQSGRFTAGGIPVGTYSLQPDSPHHQFSPTKRRFTISTQSLSGQDFLGTPYTYSLSGYVSDEYWRGVPGVTILSSAGVSAVTDGYGYYSIDGLLHGTYAITPFLGGCSFAPPDRTVSVPGWDDADFQMSCDQYLPMISAWRSPYLPDGKYSSSSTPSYKVGGEFYVVNGGTIVANPSISTYKQGRWTFKNIAIIGAHPDWDFHFFEWSNNRSAYHVLDCSPSDLSENWTTYTLDCVGTNWWEGQTETTHFTASRAQ